MSADSELFNDLMHQVQHCSRLSCQMQADVEARDILRRLAQHVRDEFPDPNPSLASPFGDWVANEIADHIENLGR